MTRRVLCFTETVVLSTTPDRAFWFTIAPDNLPKLDPGISYWEPDELPPRVGTRNRMRLQTILGIPIKVVSEFVEFDEPQRIAVVGISPFVARWALLSYDIEPLGDDRTVFTVKTYVTYPRIALPIAKIMLRVLRKRIQATNASGAERFRARESAA